MNLSTLFIHLDTKKENVAFGGVSTWSIHDETNNSNSDWFTQILYKAADKYNFGGNYYENVINYLNSNEDGGIKSYNDSRNLIDGIIYPHKVFCFKSKTHVSPWWAVQLKQRSAVYSIHITTCG